MLCMSLQVELAQFEHGLASFMTRLERAASSELEALSNEYAHVVGHAEDLCVSMCIDMSVARGIVD